MTVATPPLPVRRDPAGGMLGGVCAGLGRRLGVDPIILRLGFLAAGLAGGFGVPLYLLAWVAIPNAQGTRGLPRLGGLRAWQVAGGIACLVLAALLSLRGLGLWFSDAVVWPAVLATAGAALIWRHSQSSPSTPAPPPSPPVARPGTAMTAPEPAPVAAPGTPARAAAAATAAAGRLGVVLPRPSRATLGPLGLGISLVLGAGLVFLWLNDALRPARDVLLAVVVLLVVLGIILAPWWLRLARSLAAERAERIRSQERAELAAHLHDSVLQTLALVQRRAEDPRAVAALARRQERELRAWLNHGRPRGAPGATLAVALQDVAAEVEEAHGVPVDVVAVGDVALDAGTEAVLAAAREALVNAAKFAGGAPVSVYAEVEDGRVRVFVRDRGPGFDLDAVPADRRGLRESVVGRMRRHGGEAAIHTAAGAGTEVELSMGVGA